MLSNVDPVTPIYFGCRFKPFVKQGYMSGGAGTFLMPSRICNYRFICDLWFRNWDFWKDFKNLSFLKAAAHVWFLFRGSACAIALFGFQPISAFSYVVHFEFTLCALVPPSLKNSKVKKKLVGFPRYILEQLLKFGNNCV